MARRITYFLAGLLLMIMGAPVMAPEVLPPSKIQARASRKQPSLGLPKRLDGQIDPVVWYDAGEWKGADSLKAGPFWTMSRISGRADKGALTPVLEFCAGWASEKPKESVDLVWGPYEGGWFAAVCKKTHSALGWKSIGFIIPPGGIDPARSIFSYSRSVNWTEHMIGYDLFPKLPAYLQEIIEEMTATELLCPYQEFDPGLDEAPDRDLDRDWEDDQRERD